MGRSARDRRPVGCRPRPHDGDLAGARLGIALHVAVAQPQAGHHQIHGWCAGGGSELALCADIVIASEDAQTGTPYSRMWGCHHAGMWVYRLGLAKAKELALTDRAVSGREAAEIGLINKAVPFSELQAETRQFAAQLASIPSSQLASMKLVVNQAYDNMGLSTTQMFGSVMDTLMRNTPEARSFIEKANERGVPAADADRDRPFSDYSQASQANQPNPRNIVPLPSEPAAE